MFAAAFVTTADPIPEILRRFDGRKLSFASAGSMLSDRYLSTSLLKQNYDSPQQLHSPTLGQRRELIVIEVAENLYIWILRA